ncbi:hypothetical protein [Waterburya agarophytonicola]|uniref:hypothetical protein n=1 Tax=Waterburya agarophytonicola TaxID=2886916 RepID=UPI003F72F3D6
MTLENFPTNLSGEYIEHTHLQIKVTLLEFFGSIFRLHRKHIETYFKYLVGGNSPSPLHNPMPYPCFSG